MVFPSPLSLNCSPSPPQEIQLVSSLLIPSSCPLFCQQVVFLLPVSPNGCPLSSFTKWLPSFISKWLSSLFYHQVVVLSPLSPSGCPLSLFTKWLSSFGLSSLLYHQMVVFSITRWLFSLLYHQMVVLISK